MKYIKDGVFKINGDRVWTDRLSVKAPNKDDVNYLLLSKSYSHPPMVLKLRDRSTIILKVFTTNKNKLYLLDIDPENSAGKAITEYVQEERNVSYIGISLKLGLITIDDVKNIKEFILQVGKWLVFYWNSDYYMVVDTEPKDYVIPVMDLYGNEYWSNSKNPDVLPIFYFIDSKKIENVEVKIDTPESQEILTQLKGRNPENPKEEKKPGFIKRFFGFK